MELTTMPEHPEAIIAGKKRPFTGAEFLESLRDGREVFIYGERVKDVTTHPAFRNSAASVALLYDALHAKETKDLLTAPTDTGSGGYTHKFFKVAHSREDVIAQRDAIAAWARITYGWLGRSPTRRPSSTRSAPMPISTAISPIMPVSGTNAARRRCCSSIMRWSIRRSIATSRSRR
jgi:4-hydroxyphenylacetate 3-monooxygenase